MQREFVARYTRLLDSIKSKAGRSEAEIKESPEYQAFDAEAKTAREEIEPRFQEIDGNVRRIQRNLDAITDPDHDGTTLGGVAVRIGNAIRGSIYGALGVEALERFVRREPLLRVHECVFGVLALESEPVDPRL